MPGIFTRTRTAVAVVVAVAATSSVAGIAAADDVANNLDATVDATAEVLAMNVGGGTRTAALSIVTRNGDGKNGCNLTGDTTLRIAIASSSPGVATAALSDATFTSCGDIKVVTVTPVAQGSATITVSQVSNDTGATFNFAPATFQVTVGPSANSAPQVSVTGVTHGASYQVGTVPSAGCSVTDAEDGPSNPAPTFSGVLNADGLGSRTATCSYTDAGGLTSTVSATYSIVDNSAPVITHTLTPAFPDGQAGWWTGAPVLHWSVSDPHSPSSLEITGCEDVTIAADQDPTDYTCSATSSGGSAGPVTVTVKRDGTGPVVSYVEATGTVGDGGWFVSPVVAVFAASDAFSGVDADTDTVTSTEDGDAVVLDSPAFSDNAGNETGAGAVHSPPFMIDTVPPAVSDGELSGAKGNGIWWLSPVTATFTADDVTSGVRGDPIGTANTGENEGAVTLESPQFKDVAGNLTDSGAKQVTAHVDMTAPSVSFLKLAGVEGNAGWYRSAVTATYAGADATSGLDGDEERDVTSDHDGEFDLASPAFSDVAGNTIAAGSVKTPVKVDTVAPSVGTPSLSGEQGEDDWFLGTVLATFTASDDTSGVAGENPKTVSSANDQGTIEVESPEFEDVAGNTTPAGARVATFKVDSVAPEVAFTKLAGTEGHAGWYTSPVTVTYTATDATSGVAGDNPREVPSGDRQGEFDVESPEFSDVAGNVTEAGTVETPVKVDTVAPSVAFTHLAGDEGNQNWYLSPVTATFTAEDETSGVDGENPREVSSGERQGEFDLDSPAFSDIAGNITDPGADKVSVKVDTVEPSVADAVISGTRGANGWYTSDVTASFLATDATSGVATDNPGIVSSGGVQGTLNLVSPQFKDVAGNTTAAGVKWQAVKVDSVAPSVNLVGGPADGSSHYFGSVPAAPTCEASDATSGIAEPCTVSGYGTGVGTHTITASVKDEAGNTSTVSHTYTVTAWTGKGFYSPVDMNGVWNKVKGGSTVPLKFELFAGPNELTNIASIKSFNYRSVACDNTLASDEIEMLTSGSTSLRYDATGGQFIQNWKVPAAVGCYRATMTALDGTAIEALFKVTK